MESIEIKTYWKLYSIAGDSLDALITLISNTKNAVKSKSPNTKGAQTLEELSADQMVTTLAKLSNEIFHFFLLRPIKFEECNLGVKLSPVDSAITTIHEVQIQCEVFLRMAPVLDTRNYTKDQKELWNRILMTMKKFTQNHALITANGLEEVLDAYERFVHKSPRYTVQTSEFSEKSLLAVSNAQMMVFIESLIKKNRKYDNQRATSKEMELNRTLDSIWELAKTRLSDQRSPMPENVQEKIKADEISKILERMQGMKMENQEWVPVQIRKNEEFKSIIHKLELLDSQLDNQRFIIDDKKEFAMYVGKIDNVIARLPRLKGQDALSKEDYKFLKFGEVERALDALREGLNNQRCDPPVLPLAVLDEKPTPQPESENKRRKSIVEMISNKFRRSSIINTSKGGSELEGHQKNYQELDSTETHQSPLIWSTRTANKSTS